MADFSDGGFSILAAEPGSLITEDGQIEFDGLLLGAGTPYKWRTLDGWDDLPGVDSGNVPRSARHGSWPGRHLAQERIITWEGFVRARDVDTMRTAVQDLRSVTSIADDESEITLVIREDGETLLAFAKILRRSVPGDFTRRPVMRDLALQWVCSDPRRYSMAERGVGVDAQIGGVGGLEYPLTYPLLYGTPVTPGTATVTNEGNVPTHPLVIVRGEVENPLIVNQTTRRQLEFRITLAETDFLEIDTHAGTVLLNGTSNRLHTATAASVPVEDFTLVKGVNNIAYRADRFGPGARLEMTWRDAHL